MRHALGRKMRFAFIRPAVPIKRVMMKNLLHTERQKKLFALTRQNSNVMVQIDFFPPASKFLQLARALNLPRWPCDAPRNERARICHSSLWTREKQSLVWANYCHSFLSPAFCFLPRRHLARSRPFFCTCSFSLTKQHLLNCTDIISPALHDKRNFPRPARTVIQQSYIILTRCWFSSPSNHHLTSFNGKLTLAFVLLYRRLPVGPSRLFSPFVRCPLNKLQ